MLARMRRLYVEVMDGSRNSNRHRRHLYRYGRFRYGQQDDGAREVAYRSGDLTGGIIRCLQKSGLVLSEATDFIHGSTVAINTAIERTGARTALIVTQGMRDVYKHRARQPARSLQPVLQSARSPSCRGSRPSRSTSASTPAGEVVTPLDPHPSATRYGPRSMPRHRSGRGVLPALLCQPRHEERTAAMIGEAAPGSYLSLSHEILREYREYERMSTTVLNAYVGPRVSDYLADLDKALAAARLRRPDAHHAVQRRRRWRPRRRAAQPVRTMESGPVGGIIAAASCRGRLGIEHAIAFDMGGTTAKAALVAGRRRRDVARATSSAGAMSGHPVMLPVVDIIEVGAGGGSIAQLDEVGCAAGRAAKRRRPPRPGLLRPGRHQADGHRRQRRARAASIPSASSAARCRSTSRRPPARSAEGRRPARARRTKRPRSASSTSRWPRCRSRSAPSRSSAASTRATSRWSPSAAPARCTRRRDRARPAHPDRDRPALPGHFSALGMLLADLRHDYVRTYYRRLAEIDFAELGRDDRGDDRRGAGAAGQRGHWPTSAIASERSSTCATRARSSRSRRRSARDEVRKADLAAVRARFDELHDRRYGHVGRDEVGRDRQRRGWSPPGDANVPTLIPACRRGGGAGPPGPGSVVFADPGGRCAVSPPSGGREELSPGAPDHRARDRRGVRQHRRCSAKRRCRHRRATWENIIVSVASAAQSPRPGRRAEARGPRC